MGMRPHLPLEPFWIDCASAAAADERVRHDSVVNGYDPSARSTHEAHNVQRKQRSHGEQPGVHERVGESALDQLGAVIRERAPEEQSRLEEG